MHEIMHGMTLWHVYKVVSCYIVLPPGTCPTGLPGEPGGDAARGHTHPPPPLLFPAALPTLDLFSAVFLASASREGLLYVFSIRRNRPMGTHKNTGFRRGAE